MSNTGHPPHVSNILRSCPNENTIPYATTWYTLPSLPTFRVCNRCYSRKLASTPFAGQFTPRVESTREERGCNFNTPRIDTLLTTCLASIDFGPLDCYIRTKVGFKKCPGVEAATADKGFLWHKLDGIHGGLAACQECYNDFIVPAKARMSLNTVYPMHAKSIVQPSNQVWLCDVRSNYVKMAAKTAQTWRQLREAMEEANNQPKCAGSSPTPSQSRKWYRLRGGVLPDCSACEACFREHVSATDVAVLWEPIDGGWNQKSTTQMTCMFADPILHTVYRLAVGEKDFPIFIRAAGEILSSPACDKEGISDPSCDWYGLPQVSGREFAVCGRCFSGLVKPWGTMVGSFTRIPPPKPSDGTRVCDLNLQGPRFMTWLLPLSEAGDKNLPEIFVNYVVKYRSLKPCPRSDSDNANGQKWWGCDDFLACETCAVETISSSVAAPMMRYKGIELAGDRKCDLYSPRVRKLWSEAVQNPDVSAGLDFFSGKMKERDIMFHQTYKLVLQGIKMIWFNASMNAHTMATASLAMQADVGKQASQMFNFSEPGIVHRVGNNEYGFWATPQGFEAAQQSHAAMNAQVVDPATSMELQRLETMWKEYE